MTRIKDWTRAFWLEELTVDGWQPLALHGTRDHATRHLAELWTSDDRRSLRVMREVRIQGNEPFYKEVVRVDSAGRAAKGGTAFRPSVPVSKVDPAERSQTGPQWREDDDAAPVRAFLSPTF
ncbi:MAG: hypothetical protein ACPGNT_03345 [Rhodospirillales bacterium]